MVSLPQWVCHSASLLCTVEILNTRVCVIYFQLGSFCSGWQIVCFPLSLSFCLLSSCSWISNQRHGGSRLEAEVAELAESHTRSGQSLGWVFLNSVAEVCWSDTAQTFEYNQKYQLHISFRVAPDRCTYKLSPGKQQYWLVSCDLLAHPQRNKKRAGAFAEAAWRPHSLLGQWRGHHSEKEPRRTRSGSWSCAGELLNKSYMILK